MTACSSHITTAGGSVTTAGSSDVKTGAVKTEPPQSGSLIGVLAIQGGYEAHRKVLQRLHARVREVRTIADLSGLDGLVLPGGESTAIMLGVEREGLAEPLRALAQEGMPMLGSCAGLIMLDREHLRCIDMLAARNAFGRQVRSFEASVQMRGLEGGPLHAIFIRAPWIAQHGRGVEILAEVDGHPIAARQGNLIAVAFHSELTEDTRVHQLLLQLVRQRNGAAAQ